jgi:hypothetical protein
MVSVKEYEYKLRIVGPSEVMVTNFCVTKTKPMTLCFCVCVGDSDLSFCYQNET